jgi:hypothetical protein
MLIGKQIIALIESRGEAARFWLINRLVGQAPYIANVEVGGRNGYAIECRGNLRTNGNVHLACGSGLKACILCRPVAPKIIEAGGNPQSG